MIETITPAVCGSRKRHRLAVAGFTLGAVIASVFVGGALGLAGSLVGARRALFAVAALALLAAAREAGILRLPLPQSRRQVPERWRATLPLPFWSFGYGAGLGAGMVTFQPVATFWVACAGAVALARPVAAALCFGCYGLGRAFMVAWPRARTRDGTAAVEALVARRRALARANAVALVACAALLASAPAAGAAVTSLGRGYDPSVSGAIVARSRIVSGVHSVLIQPPDAPAVVITDAWSPSVERDRVAYTDAGGIRVVNWRTGQELVRISGSVSAPSLAWPLVAYRRVDADYERLVVADLEAGTERVAARVPLADTLSRPSLRAGYVAWGWSGAWGSRVFYRRLATWGRVLAAKSAVKLVSHPAISGARLIWIEETSRGSYMRVRRLDSTRVGTLWSYSGRDRRCWTTALQWRSAYLTRWNPATGAATIFRIDF